MLIETLGLLLLLTGQSLGGFPNIYFGGGGSGSHPGSRPGSSSSSHHNHRDQSDYDAYLNEYYSNHWQQFYQAQSAYYSYWPYGPYGGYPPYGPPPPPTTEAPETTPETTTGTPTTPTTSTAIPTSTGDPTTSTAVASQTPPLRLWLRTTPLPFHYVPEDLIGPYRSQLPTNVHISEEGGPHDDQQGPNLQFVGKK